MAEREKARPEEAGPQRNRTGLLERKRTSVRGERFEFGRVAIESV